MQAPTGAEHLSVGGVLLPGGGEYGQPVGGIVYGESVAAWWRVNRCKGKTLMQTTQIGSSPEVHRYQTQITWRAGDARDGCRPHNQSANDGVIYRGP